MRITPAYAGNTKRCLALHILDWDHPRIRGEYNDIIDELYIKLGSPPHTRGIRYWTYMPRITLWITPAYAGNTFSGSLQRPTDQDHPRIRGEYPRIFGNNGNTMGSPPHTRGIRVKQIFEGLWIRITPAYAGNTMHSIIFQDSF